jgi:hypothetical protein
MRLCALGLFAVAAFCQTNGTNHTIEPKDPELPFTLEDRYKYLFWSIAGPGAAIKSVAVAGIAQWRDKPTEWGQGMDGYGRRIGYRYLRRSVNNSVEFSVGALIGEDPRYFRARNPGLWGRVGHATKSVFVSPTADGGRRFAFARFAGAYGGAWISNAWYPQRLQSPEDVLRRGSYSLGGEILGNLWREFWPDVRRRVFRR